MAARSACRRRPGARRLECSQILPVADRGGPRVRRQGLQVRQLRLIALDLENQSSGFGALCLRHTQA